MTAQQMVVQSTNIVVFFGLGQSEGDIKTWLCKFFNITLWQSLCTALVAGILGGLVVLLIGHMLTYRNVRRILYSDLTDVMERVKQLRNGIEKSKEGNPNNVMQWNPPMNVDSMILSGLIAKREKVRKKLAVDMQALCNDLVKLREKVSQQKLYIDQVKDNTRISPKNEFRMELANEIEQLIGDVLAKLGKIRTSIEQKM